MPDESKNLMVMQLLADRDWHSKAIVKHKIIRKIPPEYFLRLRINHHHTGVPSISSWWFAKTLWCLLRDDIVERRIPGGAARPATGQDYDIRLTDKGYARYIQRKARALNLA